MFQGHRDPRILEFQSLSLTIQNAFMILRPKRRQFLNTLEVKGLDIAIAECFDFDPRINWSELDPDDEKSLRENGLDEGFDHRTWSEFLKWCQAADKLFFRKFARKNRLDLLVWYLSQENPISTEINTSPINNGEVFTLPRENSSS